MLKWLADGKQKVMQIPKITRSVRGQLSRRVFTFTHNKGNGTCRMRCHFANCESWSYVLLAPIIGL